MPRKSALLLHLLNLVLRSIAGQTSAPSNQFVAFPQHPLLLTDHEAWRAYWQAQGQPWRTEPEIDEKRQEYLAQRRAISPEVEHGIYPFKGMKLSRADVEWLLATHENGLGPVDWNDERQRKREGLDLRGADLSSSEDQPLDLSNLPLSRLRGGPSGDEWINLTEEQRAFSSILLKHTYLSKTHLEGAVLSEAHLEEALLDETHLERANLFRAHLEGAVLSEAHLEEANLMEAYLEEAVLQWAYLAGVDLAGARLKDADLHGAHLEGADLRRAHLEEVNLSQVHLNKTWLDSAIVADNTGVGPTLADIEWGKTNLSVIDWSRVMILGDEKEAKKARSNLQLFDEGTFSITIGATDKADQAKKGKYQRLKDYQKAVRANRQLAIVLQNQGLSEEAARFAYRAQVLQKTVFRYQILQSNIKLRQRLQLFGAWLFSWFLFLLAGYGYRLWRSFLVYVLVITGFTAVYYLLGASFNPPLSLVNALGLSMTSFHGRGFFPGVTQLNDLLTILASLEAFVGLILEATFIATLTQRFFGK